MKKILVLVVVGILVLLVASVAAREVIVDETARVQIDDYRFYAMYLNDGDKITVQIQQTAKGLFGPPTVDVYLFDSKQFDEYQKMVAGYTGGFGECYSAKDIVQKAFTWTASRPDTYYLVLDNTERLRGGGVYGGIIVDVRVEKETPIIPEPKLPERSERSSPKEPGFGVISAIAGVLIVLYLIRRNR